MLTHVRTPCSSKRLVLGDGFQIDLDPDLITNQNTARLQGEVPGEAKILAKASISENGSAVNIKHNRSVLYCFQKDRHATAGTDPFAL
jgi:hypothetical protein